MEISLALQNKKNPKCMKRETKPEVSMIYITIDIT